MEQYEQIYNYELDKLLKFCKEIGINVEIIDGQIEYIVFLTGNGQFDIFGDNNDSKILITTALETRVKSEGKLDISAADLKKIIKLVEKAARAFYVYFRESQFEGVQE